MQCHAGSSKSSDMLPYVIRYCVHLHARVTNSGGRSYIQIVESYRVEGDSLRQRVIANFGRLDQLEPEDLEPLINGLNRAIGGTSSDTFTPEYDSAKAYGDVFMLHEL